MAGNYTRRINLYINGTQVKNDIKSIRAEFNRLNKTINTLNIDSREYVANMTKLKYLNSIIEQHNARLRNTQLNLTSLKGLANAFNKYWPVIMGTIGAVTGLVMGTQRASDEFTEFDDKIADVMKVTNMTREEVIALNGELMKIDTRTAQNDLLDLAYVAGKLGIRGEENITGFVNAANQISVALSKELGGSAEEAVRAIGKAVQIFDLDKVYGIEEAMLRVGSAVNLLGMSSTAQEGFLVNFLERTAGIAPLAGVSADKILGLAATLDKYGQKAEVSATAYSKLMSKMATESESMAKIMGMSIADYVTAFTEDANETMLRLFECLKGEGAASFTELVQLLGETDLEGQRMTQVMGTMVNKVDEIRRQMDLSTKAMEENTSITNEYNIKNNNAAAIIEKKKKSIKALRVELGEKLMPVYEQYLSASEYFIKVTGTVVQFLFNHRRAIISLITYLLIYRTTLAIINAIKTTSIVIYGVMRAAILRVQIAYFALTHQMYRAAKAQVLLNSLAVTNPWTLLASAILGIVGAIVAFNTKVADTVKETFNYYETLNQLRDENQKKVIEEKVESKLLFQQILSLNEASALRNELVQTLIEKYPELLKGLDAEYLRLASIEQIMQAVNRSTETKLKLAAVEAEIEAKKQLYVENARKMMAAEKKMEDMRKYPGLHKEGEPDPKEKEILVQQGVYDMAVSENKRLMTEMNDLVTKAKKIELKSITDEIEIQKNELAQIGAELSEKKKELTIAQNNKDEDEITRAKGELYQLKLRETATRQIIKNLQDQYNARTVGAYKGGDGGDGGDGDGKGKEDKYSENAEIQARINAKNKYRVGIIKSEQDLNVELNRIALTFMQGRLAAMDKDAEKRLELQEKIVDKQLEIARDSQKHMDELTSAGVEFSPVQKADLDFNNDLKKLNIFYKKQSEMTTEELLAFQALQKKHQLVLDKLDADAIKSEVERNQSAFDSYMVKLRTDQMAEMDSVITFDDAMLLLRQNHSAEELADIKTLNQARMQLQKDQQAKVTEETIKHTEQLVSLLNTFMADGSWEGLNLADSIMSEEEWAAVKKILDELIETLGKLKKEKKEATEGSDTDNSEDGIKLKGQFKTDILGFTSDDWEEFFQNLQDGSSGINDMAMAAYALGNAWSSINQLIKNNEDTALAEYEQRCDRKKEALQRQLDVGKISQEQYNARVTQIDKNLDYQRAVMARKQAVRDRNAALYSAIVNTAAGVADAIPNLALMIIAGAAGALQIATIASTPLPVIPGRQAGGSLKVLRQQDGKMFNAQLDIGKRGWVNRPTILAGEKPGGMEYVVPDQAVNNPTIRPFLNILEMARVNNKLSTLNMNAVLPALSGRQGGGYILNHTPDKVTNNAPAENESGSKSSGKEFNKLLLGAINRLNRNLEKPMKANLVYQELEDFTEKVKTIESDTQL